MIVARAVTRDYRDGDTVVHALRGVDMEINDGEFLAIAGPSGSGKSTLLNILGCIDRATSGSVRYGDIAVEELGNGDRARLRRENLGFVFQSFNLIPVLTAAENVELALSLDGTRVNGTGARVSEILAEVGLEGLEHRRPAQLSGGQQQRVAIARALVKKPMVVFADEPTANLDSKTGEAILALMRQIHERHGTSFVFSTHDRMVMDFAGRLVRLHDGRIES
ncbi:MAG: ABC transporter ATP-binding protein [Spirochaetaceae bacterium]